MFSSLMKFFSLCSKNSILTRFVQRLHVHSSSVHGSENASSVHGSENALALNSHSAQALVFIKLLSGYQTNAKTSPPT